MQGLSRDIKKQEIKQDRSINDIKITIETQLAEKIFQHMKLVKFLFSQVVENELALSM